jgi:hypothetical protein
VQVRVDGRENRIFGVGGRHILRVVRGLPSFRSAPCVKSMSQRAYGRLLS